MSTDRRMPDDEAALRAAVAGSPLDDAPPLILADWLQERGREAEAARLRQEVAVRAALLGLARAGRSWDEFSQKVLASMNDSFRRAGEAAGLALGPAVEAFRRVAERLAEATTGPGRPPAERAEGRP